MKFNKGLQLKINEQKKRNILFGKCFDAQKTKQTL